MQPSLLFWIIPATLLGAVLSALLASVLLLFPAKTRSLLLPSLVSFAVGALLGAAFLDLLPEAVKSAAPGQVQGVGLAIALGVLGFFLLEKLAFWHHGHEGHMGHEELRQHAAGTMILVGTGLHNLLDGVLLGATFITSVRMGVVLAIAVIAHQIPQQVGDISVLLSSGTARGRALLLSAFSAGTMVVGGVAAFFLLGSLQAYIPYVLAIAAASLIYVAVADLIPGLHRHEGARLSLLTVALIAAGIGLIWVIQTALGG